MKRIVSLWILLVFAFDVISQQNGEMNDSTYYPLMSSYDYKAKQHVFVKSAFPVHADSSRIWVKGDPKFNSVFITTSDGTVTLTEPITLQPPFFTHVVSVSNNHQKIAAHFSSAMDTRIRWANLTTLGKIKHSEDFAILFYGCFQPFKVNKDKTPGLIVSHANNNFKMRALFEKVALSKTFNYYSGTRNIKRKHRPDFSEETVSGKLIASPKLIIGTGDQIYVDAGYKFKKGRWSADKFKLYRGHPLAAWSYAIKDPMPILSVDGYTAHLNKTYNAVNSFTSLDTVFTSIPLVNVWDDHEIRDGWGSHGDEYPGGSLNPKLRDYYLLSRDAFFQHQFIPGPDANSRAETFHQSFDVGDVSVFTFDLRSKRDITIPRVLGDTQMTAFRNWCESVPHGRHAIIVSSIPIFHNNTKLTEKLIEGLKKELRDDIADTWSFPKNTDERDVIVNEIIALRNRGVFPIIVSGDIHEGAVTEVWYEPAGPGVFGPASKVLCYELIASGLSHESLGEGHRRTIGRTRLSSKKARPKDPSFIPEGSKTRVYPLTRYSRRDLNFGAIEFTANNKSKMSTFTIRKFRGEERYYQHTLDLEWNKPISEDKIWRYKTFKQRIYNLFHLLNPTFTPAIPDVVNAAKVE
jgi:hypothetical protein